MVINQIHEYECREVLARAALGRIGCSFQDQPYVVPVYLACEADHIYVFSTYGKKIEWMRANPKVCVQIDEITSQSAWVSVVVNGHYQELTEPQFEHERAQARALLQRRQEWWLRALAEDRIRVRDKSAAALYFRIEIDSMSGLLASSDST